jgi:hypothetical protein
VSLDCLRLMSCVQYCQCLWIVFVLCLVSYVASVSGLFSSFVLCLMLPVSLDCFRLMSCPLCFQCLWSTLGTPDTGQRQTNKNTTQRYCQHWVHQTQDRDKQTKTQHRDTGNIGYTRHRTKTNCVFVCLSLSCVWCTQC